MASCHWCRVSLNGRAKLCPRAFARARADQLALELGKPAARGRGVRPCVIEGTEARALAEGTAQLSAAAARAARGLIEDLVGSGDTRLLH